MSHTKVWKVDFSEDIHLIPVTFNPEPETLNAASAKLPDGAYTTFRTFFINKALHVHDHLTRLKETACLTEQPIQLNEDRARAAIRIALQQKMREDKRVRLIIDLEDNPGTLYILVEPLCTPSNDDYIRGVQAVTRRMQRENPKAKLTRFISTAGEVRHELPSGIHEALMVDPQGHILEGLSSNFFAVINSEIWTEEDKVLSGITRSIVLQEAREEKIPVHLNSISMEDLPKVSEAFITSSSRDVLPVTRIDNQVIGSGLPGPITQKLLQRYQNRIRGEVEPI